jgi:predicted Zn-dependent protease
MDLTTRNQVFHRALKAYREGDLQTSLHALRQLLENGSHEPRHISYCGLVVAKAEGKVEDGRILCEKAVKEASDDPEMYLNLSKVYSSSGHRSLALDVLRDGLRVAPKDPALNREIESLDPRTPKPLVFLRRNNIVNKYLGRTRSRLSSRFRRS